VSKSKSGDKYENTKGVVYKAVGVPDQTFIHPSSALYGSAPPDWIVFGEVVRTSRVWVRSRSFFHAKSSVTSTHLLLYAAITRINPAWLPKLGKSLCTFSRPLEMPSAASKAKNLKEAAGQETREAFVTPHYGDLGLDLPVIKVIQKKDRGRWITQV
jgi:ATP-dependent RNA helicase DHX37/DHR1